MIREGILVRMMTPAAAMLFTEHQAAAYCAASGGVQRIFTEEASGPRVIYDRDGGIDVPSATPTQLYAQCASGGRVVAVETRHDGRIVVYIPGERPLVRRANA